MSNKKLKVGNVPNLRFPGFEGDIKRTLFTEVCKIGTGNKNTQDREEGGLYPFYVRSSTIEKINSYTFDGEAILTAGDGVGVGKVFHYTNGKIGVHQRVYILSEFKEVIGKFLFYYFSTKFNDRVSKLSAKNSVDSVRYDMIAKMPIAFPDIKEQLRISELLSVIDERIATQSKIIKELNVLKTTVTQKVFSRELRFKDNNGKSFVDWEEKKMKSLFSFKTTNSLSREYLNYQQGNVKNIHYGDIHTKFQTLFNIENETVPFINSTVNIDKIDEEFYCKIGDIIFADASEDLNNVGKSIEIINVGNQKVLAGLHTILARPANNIFSSGFCGHLFNSKWVRTQIQKESQGSKVLSISTTRLSNISLHIPCLEEQKKILNFLSSIDSKIVIENQLLQKLEKQKKFLLQNFFI